MKAIMITLVDRRISWTRFSLSCHTSYQEVIKRKQNISIELGLIKKGFFFFFLVVGFKFQSQIIEFWVLCIVVMNIH